MSFGVLFQWEMTTLEKVIRLELPRVHATRHESLR
jgi:hypothetical protein